MACCVFIFVLNTSPVFAATIAKIPYLGDICQIFTFIHIEEDEIKSYMSMHHHFQKLDTVN